MRPLSFLGVVPFCALGAYGWGASGHQTVGYIAMQFLAPKALEFVTTSLGSNYSQSLGPAATWPDLVKYTAPYAWSAQLHYVDALDNPPTTCSVEQTRDCANGQCILSAIANYTTRVVDKSLSDDQRQEALKFLDHFIGDITQPLHVENFKIGGNAINVTCNGTTTNLHAIWDTNMINQLLASQYNNSVTTWADTLVTHIKSGPYKRAASHWISCSSTTKTVLNPRAIVDDIAGLLDRRDVAPLKCPLVWAQDANKFDCSYIFSYTNGTDLCTTSYYTNAIPIIETQVAKAGYRLAAWLNVLFDGCTKL